MGIRSLIQKLKGAGRSGRTNPLAAPPTLSGATRFPYGPFRFKTRLGKGNAYIIEASTDFKTWTPVSKGISSAEEFEYVDSDASKFGHRFYRVLAGELLSNNVIGYAAVALPPGFSMIGNPLVSPENTVGKLFKDWPEGTSLNKFDTRLFRLAENTVKAKQWTNPSERLMPGEGAIFFNPTSDYKSHSFVGEVAQGQLSIPIPAGFSVRSSLVPLPGSLEELGFPITNGDVIHLFDRDRQKYVLHPYEDDKWQAGPPVVSVGEAFWVAKTEPGNWTRNLRIAG